MVNGKKFTSNKYRTECMVISFRQKLIYIGRAPEIKLGGTSIKSVKQSKTLGIKINNQLLWNKQINGILPKFSIGIGFLVPK